MSAPPTWLRHAGGDLTVDRLTPFRGPSSLRERRVPDGVTARPAAVLVLFSGSESGTGDPRAPFPPDADVLLTQRASSLRQHGGQIAFPGGAVDPGDGGPVATALREANEETGLDPAEVSPLAVLDPIFVPPSGFDVTPVLAWWSRPGRVWAVDPGETERVARVPLHRLVDPANRYVVRHRLGYESPAFEIDGMLIWGFTAGILAGLFDEFGWGRDWDTTDVRDFDTAAAAVRRTTDTAAAVRRTTGTGKTGIGA